MPKIWKVVAAVWTLATGVVSGQIAPCFPAPATPRHWYRGEGASEDAVGRLHGELQGAASYTSSGKVGGSFDFGHGVLRLYPRPEFDQIQNLTIEAWVYPRSSGIYNDTVGPVIVSKDLPQSDPSISFSLAGPSNTGKFRASVGLEGAPPPGGARDPAIFSTGSYGYNQFHHVVMTWDGFFLRLYVNGVLSNQLDCSIPGQGARQIAHQIVGDTTTRYDVGIGRHPLFGTRNFDGLIDEVSIYDVALSAAEVATLYDAGSGRGKCPTVPTAIEAPAGLDHWWRGDWDAADAAGGAFGARTGDVRFGPGKTGVGFDFYNGIVRIPSTDSLQSPSFTVEAWAAPRGTGLFNDTVGSVIVSKDINVSPTVSYGLVGPNTQGRFGAFVGFADGGPPNNIMSVSSPNRFALNVFHHVAMSYDQGYLKLYVDGRLEKSLYAGSARPIIYGGDDLGIGRHANFGTRNFDGRIDEVAHYSRALSDAEIEALYLAGTAGKIHAPAPSCASVPDGLTQWWSGEDSTIARVGGVAGVIEGAVSYANGKVGRAFSFTDGLVRIPSPAAPGPRYLTVETWINNTARGDFVDTLGPVIVSKDVAVAPTVSFSLTGPGGTGKFSAFVGFTDGSFRNVESEHAFDLNVDYHVAMTWDGIALRLYVNGNLEAESIVNAPGSSAPIKVRRDDGEDIGIGKHAMFGTRRFVGRIDEPSIYSRALDAGEIRAVYLAGAAGKCADLSSPTVTIASPADGLVTSASSITVSGQVLDESGTTVTSTPGTDVVSLPAGGGTYALNVPLLVEGANTIAVHAIDDPQNEPGGTSIVVVRDSLAPELTVTSPAENAVLADAFAEFAVAVADATAVSVTASGEVRTAPEGGGILVFPLALSPGINVVQFTAVDAAGNAAAVVRTVFVDLDLPLVAITSPANGAVFGPNAPVALVSVSVSDASPTEVVSTPAGVAASLPAGGGVASGAIALVPGYNVLQATATDAAARIGVAECVVLLDVAAPSAAVVSPAPGFVRGAVDFAAEATDPAPASGVVAVTLLLDGFVYASFAAPPYRAALDTSALSDGAHQLAVVAVDAAGNESPLSVVAITVDNTAPEATFAAPVAGATVSGTYAIQVAASDAESGVVEIGVVVDGAAPSTDPSVVYATPQATALVAGTDDSLLRPNGPATLTCTVFDAAGNTRTSTLVITVSNGTPSYAITSPEAGARLAGVATFAAETTDGTVSAIDLRVDGALLASGQAPAFSTSYDTYARLDGRARFVARFHRTDGSFVERVVVAVVNNLAVELKPATLNIRRRESQNGRVIAHVEGVNAAILLGSDVLGFELRVPGADPIPSTAEWPGGDTLVDSDADGVPELKIRFDRRPTAAALRAAVAAGRIDPDQPVRISLYARLADGRAALIGRDRIRIVVD
jgi:hypothetical protein